LDHTPDKEKFLQLIEENKRIIFKICNAYCPNKQDREDLAQEIVYQLWKSAGNFNDDYRFSTWMYRVALNVAISFYRKQKSNKTIVPLSDDLNQVTEMSGTHHSVEENILLLQQFIRELRELDRALMILYLEEKSHRDISEIIGISETNVATRIGRIKEKLKQRFANINQ
jgi:RNA polymerase sigma-70 factor (ECF subfamily)